MRYTIYFAILIVLIVAAAVAAAAECPWWSIAVICTLAIACAFLLLHAVATPLSVVQNGIYLFREQDFSSRLRHTGQADADKVVDLYNTLIDSMKAERLKNLEQNRFLKLVVDASPLGIAVCDFNGKIIDTNCAWNNMQSPLLHEAIASVADGTTETRRLADALIVRISKLWFMDSGFRRRFILVERLTEEIASAEKSMFSKTVRTIGHEVNNTLGSVISVLDTMQDVYDSNSLEFNTISSCRNSCINLVNFVHGYADIVKLPPISPETVEPHSLIAALIPTLKGMAPSNIAINYSTPSSHVKVSLDPMLFERGLINIVKNSIESIGDSPNGLISIDVTVDGHNKNMCRLTVTDNGKGISENAASKLFTPFFSTKQPDRGLGLMLIADILRAHHFRFSLSTSTDTRLTSFAILMKTLP